ncbi:MAG: aminotransferase class I/II-fold pyridoxal phosphate-dependent enzyme [Nitrosarchaeum sp.]
MIYLDEFTREEISTRSKYVEQFEQAVADYLRIDSDYVVATNSGTSALHLALLAAGVKKPGDDVLLPVLTYGASVNAIKMAGGNPVFVDVDKDTWLADFNYELFEDGIYKFAMPVDLYGNIFNIIHFDEYDVSIIIDAAESFYQSASIDADYYPNTFYCFSFNGNKVLSTGAGGVVINGDINNIEKIKSIASQGKSPAYNYDGLHLSEGFNYRMAGINAKYGLVHFKYIGGFLKRKEKFNEIYRNELDNIVTFQKINCSSNYWMIAILLPENESVIDTRHALKLEGIPTRRIFRPLNHSEPFRDGKTYPNAEMIYNRGLCLPSSHLNTDDDIYMVCKTLKKLLKG